MPALYLATGREAGDEISSTYEGRHITIEESYMTHPTHTDGFVDKGDPILVGEDIVGVALISAAAATDLISVDTEGIWFLSAVAEDYEGNSAIAPGDVLFLNKTTCILSKNSNKYTHQRFGYALGDVASGYTDIVAVKVHWNPDDAEERVGTSSVPMPIAEGSIGYVKRYSTLTEAGGIYGEYTQLDVLAAGTQTAISGRNRVMLKADGVGNAYGRHDTLETDTLAGTVTGLGVGHRGNLVVANRAHAAGTWYGALAELFPLGNTAAVPAGSNAALGVNIQPGTAMDLVGNLIAFGGTDGTTKPIYTHNPGNTFSGALRILVNGAVKYLYFADSE